MKHKESTIQSISELFYMKNLCCRVFRGWQYEHRYRRYLKYMREISRKHYNHRMLSTSIRNWRLGTMDEKKFEIKYKLARVTEREIDKTQKGFNFI